MGAKKRPFYRIIVADARSPRDGRFIETLGYYDPLTQPKTVKISSEKYHRWVRNGAQPSDSVKGILKRSGALEAPAADLVPATTQAVALVPSAPVAESAVPAMAAPAPAAPDSSPGEAASNASTAEPAAS